MGRKPEDTLMPAGRTADRLFTLKREKGPNGITLTAIWTGLTEEDALHIAEGAESLVEFPDDYDPWAKDWDGGGAGDSFQ